MKSDKRQRKYALEFIHLPPLPMKRRVPVFDSRAWANYEVKQIGWMTPKGKFVKL